MKKKTIYNGLVRLLMVLALVIVITIPTVSWVAEPTFLPPYPSKVPSGGIGHYIPGGRNVEAYRYVHSPGYPPFPDRGKFTGTLTGSWYNMGKQFGARSGDETRCVSDIWWKESCELFGKAETLKAMELFEAQIAALDPNLVEFMNGIADGAAPWLNQSIYANKSHPLYATNYERVLAVNIYDDWVMSHPSVFPDGSSTCGGILTCPAMRGIGSCSAFSARGAATSNGQVIAAHDRQIQYDPRSYLQAYIIHPPKGNAAWILTNCPQVAANQVVNEKGVSIILLFGGVSNPNSWDYPGGPYFAEGFGVPWFSLFLYVGTHADTAEEAIKMLTVGTSEYRARTGRNSLLRAGGWLFMVTDKHTMAVVEVTADRYAVRYPGEFTGPEWTSKDYIVCTNHYLSDFSYDKDNNLTNVPMTIFTVLPPSDTEVRFWTLMWDMKKRYGQIDRYMAQHIMSGRYANDKDTGQRIDCADVEGKLSIYCDVGSCTEGSQVGLVSGSADCKVGVLDGAHSEIYWTMGIASDWQGAWDAYYFKKNQDER